MEKQLHRPSRDGETASYERHNCRECMYAIGLLENRKRGQKEVPYYCLQYRKISQDQGCYLMGRFGFPTFTLAKYRKAIPALNPPCPIKDTVSKDISLCNNLIFGKQLGMRCEDQLFTLDIERCCSCTHCCYGITCGIFCNEHGVVLYEIPKAQPPGKEML